MAINLHKAQMLMETWFPNGKSILAEDQYSTKQGRRAISYMKKNGITDPNQQKKIIDALMNDLEIHHTDDPRFNYIVGCTRLYLNKELTNFESINSLKTVLKYVSDNGHQGQYDENLNNLSLRELSDRFTALQQADSEQSRNNVNSLGYGDRSINGYKIVKIESENQCEEYGDYTEWCITHGSYSNYQLDGTNQCYFCLKPGFDEIEEPEDTSNAPFDEYGLSMISVIVDYNGEPLYITTRYNHDYDGENNPELCTAEQVSRLIGVDFYKVFQPNEKGLELKKKMDIYKAKVDSNLLFVDMGLSVKWCNVNVDADSPSDSGGYYAWGETEEKVDYSRKTYDFNKPFEDVAQARGLGRMPSIDEFKELLNSCEWLWDRYNGVNGFYVGSKVNGNCIFLPAAGDRYGNSIENVGFLGYYWSSTMCKSDRTDAYYLYFDSGYKGTYSIDRNFGYTVRFVTD